MVVNQIVIAADPATVRRVLGEIAYAGIDAQERSGGVERLKVYTFTTRLPGDTPSAVRTPSAIAELGLTKRLVEVLELTAEGLSRKEIGERLFLSDLTVKSHLARLYKRLGVDRRETAVAAGFRRGILGGGA